MFGRNKEKTEHDENKKEVKNAEAVKKDGKKVCPCCDRHCPVDNLHCSKGRKHFGLSEDEKNTADGRGQGEHGRGTDDHEQEGHSRGFGMNGHSHGTDGHRRGKHGEKEADARTLDESRMTTSEITYALLRSCGHYLHHASGEGSPETMFAALSEDEKKELNALLRKVVRSWKKEG